MKSPISSLIRAARSWKLQSVFSGYKPLALAAALPALGIGLAAQSVPAMEVAALNVNVSGEVTCSAEENVIRVTVDNVKKSKGWVTGELFVNNDDTFLKKAGRLQRVRVEAQEGATELCLAAPESGTYAVVVFHDQNKSKKLDRNFLGIPKEGFGFSNNPKIAFSKPKIKEVAMMVDGKPTDITISLNYF